MAIHMANEERLIDSLTAAQRRALEGLLRTLLVGLERS